MELQAKSKISGIPNGLGLNVDVISGQSLLQISANFVIGYVRGTVTDYYNGLTAYAHKAQVALGFSSEYQLIDVEFRRPYDFLEKKELLWSGVNLLKPTLSDAWQALTEIGVACEKIDVGFKVPELGISFFSDEFEGDLDVRLDAVCVHFSP
jgi:hypothetical protein